MQQLDIFEHSRDVMLRGDLCEALLARDAAAARRTFDTFVEELPDDAAKEPARMLVLALAQALQQPHPPAFADAAEATAAAGLLRATLLPSAEQFLPRGSAQGWLAPHWAALARRAAPLRFAPENAQAHAAPMWLQAHDWLAARQAVEGIESWRRIPQPLAWATEARHQALGLEATWPLWVELSWLAPRRFEELARRVAHPQLDKLMGQFNREFEGPGGGADDGEGCDDWPWFPAWCLVHTPALAGPMDGATPSAPGEPARAWALLQSLLRLERQGRHHEIVAQRKQLSGCHAGLFALYMRTR